MGSASQSGAVEPAVAAGAWPPATLPAARGPLTRLCQAVIGEIEAEQPRWFLWIAVAFGSGAATYFAAAVEPPLWALATLAGMAALVHMFARRVGLWGLASGFLLVLALGAATAKLRTEFIRAPVLARPLTAVQVKGWVELVEPRPARGQRVTIRLTSLERLPPEAWPHRVRVRTMTETTGLKPGMAVRVRATLAAPQAPSLPGDFDFGRYAWFNALGAIGLATGPLVIEDITTTPPWSLRLKAGIEGVRYWITRRIMTALPGETGAIAAALITGERGGISDATNSAYRDSGLFHILSISGLHMVVMAGAIFTLIRLLLAACAPIALNYPIKKWAAFGAMIGALGYLLISGSSFATVRSYLMISVMFFAIMLDRNAVALRNVALAALLILVVYPESIFDPGFQMSFAAVTGLISIYEWMKLRQERHAPLADRGPIATGFAHFTGICTSTLIASAAVAPFGIYHFHNTQLLAMIANLVALPLCDLYVMPLALGVLIALPFGLESWPLTAMAWGIDGMSFVARWVAALPGSVVRIPAIPALSFQLMVAGGVWLLLWSRSWRWLGLLPIAVGLLVTPTLQRPDMLISRDGTTVAVRGGDGRLSAVAVRGGMFELARWLEFDGDIRPAKDVAAAANFTCDAVGCVTRTGAREIAILASAAALRDHCGSASVIVMRFLASRGCQPTSGSAQPIMIDPQSLRAGDGHMLTFKPDGIAVTRVADARGLRPWTQAGRAADTAPSLAERPPRDTNVPFATTPAEPLPDPDDEDRPGRGLAP
jgi:competence protein ComEC